MNQQVVVDGVSVVAAWKLPKNPHPELAVRSANPQSQSGGWVTISPVNDRRNKRSPLRHMLTSQRCKSVESPFPRARGGVNPFPSIQVVGCHLARKRFQCSPDLFLRRCPASRHSADDSYKGWGLAIALPVRSAVDAVPAAVLFSGTVILPHPESIPARSQLPVSSSIPTRRLSQLR